MLTKRKRDLETEITLLERRLKAAKDSLALDIEGEAQVAVSKAFSPNGIIQAFTKALGQSLESATITIISKKDRLLAQQKDEIPEEPLFCVITDHWGLECRTVHNNRTRWFVVGTKVEISSSSDHYVRHTLEECKGAFFMDVVSLLLDCPITNDVYVLFPALCNIFFGYVKAAITAYLHRTAELDEEAYPSTFQALYFDWPGNL